MKKSILLFSVIAAGMALTSCLDDDDNKVTNTLTRSYANCFNTVYDSATGIISVTEQPKYTLTIKTSSDGNNLLKLEMTNIKLGDEIANTTFELPEMPMTISGTAAPYAEATDVRPTNLSASQSVNFSKIYVSVLDRYIHNEASNANEFYPVYTINFVVNNRYNVTVYPTEIYYFGETTSTADADGSVYTTKSPRYAMIIDPAKKKARIDITGAQFVGAMPAMNMTFPDVEFTPGISDLTLASDALTPTIAGTPYPSFPITALEAVISPRKGSATLEFDCDAARMGKYHVDAALDYLPRDK